jgi:hypothetical protein
MSPIDLQRSWEWGELKEIQQVVNLLISGPGRQVQDAAYFQLLLRQQLNSIAEETKRLNRELDSAVKENSNYVLFEKKYGFWLIQSGRTGRRAAKFTRPIG